MPSQSQIWFRHADSRFPFLWATAAQPAARWHGTGEGPANYLADTPDGAWAEFLRHEEITDPADLVGVRRRLWAVEVPASRADNAARPRVAASVRAGGLASYGECQAIARRLRARGVDALLVQSAALLAGSARGQGMHAGTLVEASRRNGRVLVLFGRDHRGLRGWACGDASAPTDRLLSLVAHL